MPVKLFTAYEHDAVRSLDSRINDWIDELPEGFGIRQISSAMGTHRRSDTGEDHPYLVVTLLYDYDAPE